MEASARSKAIEQRGSRTRPALHPLEHAALQTAAERDGSHCDAPVAPVGMTGLPVGEACRLPGCCQQIRTAGRLGR